VKSFNKVFVVAMVISMLGCAGMQPITEADRTFERIVHAPGHKKDTIYDSTRIWIAENFRSAKSVIEYEDKEIGTIVCKGAMKYPGNGIEHLLKSDWNVLFTMRVDVKDERFRLTFDKLKLTWPPSYNSTYGIQSGYEGPVKTKADLDAIKPALLNIGNRICSHIGKGHIRNDW
jgi:hypothetical protein